MTMTGDLCRQGLGGEAWCTFGVDLLDGVLK